MIENNNEPITKITLCHDFYDLKMSGYQRREIVERLKENTTRANKSARVAPNWQDVGIAVEAT